MNTALSNTTEYEVQFQDARGKWGMFEVYDNVRYSRALELYHEKGLRYSVTKQLGLAKLLAKESGYLHTRIVVRTVYEQVLNE